MPLISEETWFDLFSVEPNLNRTVSMDMRAVRKRGQPFLLLPANTTLAAQALNLYPAQTRRARAANKLLSWLLLTRCPWGLEKVSLNISPDDPFIGFLTKLAGLPKAACSTFAILAGNPATPGRRFVILVFNADEEPVAVVKAGLGISARQLIEKEAAFLRAIPPNMIGIPKICDTYDSKNISALALKFFAGDSPRTQDQPSLAPLLTSWLDDQRTVPLAELPLWQRLEKACGSNSLLLNLGKTLGAKLVHPTIYHGDLAPWNIKVSTKDQSWTVLDWERAESSGVPGWDWFHYVIQTGILVERRSTPALIRKIKALLASPDFQRYAERAGFTGYETELLLAYLLHVIELLKPAEGLSAARDLLNALAVDWLKD